MKKIVIVLILIFLFSIPLVFSGSAVQESLTNTEVNQKELNASNIQITKNRIQSVDISVNNTKIDIVNYQNSNQEINSTTESTGEKSTSTSQINYNIKEISISPSKANVDVKVQTSTGELVKSIDFGTISQNASSLDEKAITNQFDPVKENLPSIEIMIKSSEREGSTGENTKINISKLDNYVTITSNSITSTTKNEIKVEENNLYVVSANEKKQVKVMPDEVFSSSGISEAKISLGIQDGSANYVVNGTKKGKLFGLFDSEYEVTKKISAETGKLVSEDKPFWSLFVFG